MHMAVLALAKVMFCRFQNAHRGVILYSVDDESDPIENKFPLSDNDPIAFNFFQNKRCQKSKSPGKQKLTAGEFKCV